MNPLGIISIYHASEPVPADDLKDVSWIYALQAKLNPSSLKPSESASIAIYHSWRAILSNLVICDLRVGALGTRVHAWKSKRCLIVYKLSPDTDYIRSLGFFDEDDIISSEKEDAWKDICLRYALNATWIFCPAISSDPDVELPSHIQQIIDSCQSPSIRLVHLPKTSVPPSPDFAPTLTAASLVQRSESYLSFGSSSFAEPSWPGECPPTSLASSKMNLEAHVLKQLYDTPRRPGSVPVLIPTLVPSVIIQAEDDADHPIHTYGPHLVINSPITRSSFCLFGRRTDDGPIQQALGVPKVTQFHVEAELKAKKIGNSNKTILARVTKKIVASVTTKGPRRLL